VSHPDIPVEKARAMIGHAARLERVAEGLGNGDGAALRMYFESPTRRALMHFVEALSPAERRALVALMWLGRGDDGETGRDWAALLAEAGRVSPNGDVLGLVGRNELSNYLEAGLEKLGVEQ